MLYPPRIWWTQRTASMWLVGVGDSVCGYPISVRKWGFFSQHYQHTTRSDNCVWASYLFSLRRALRWREVILPHREVFGAKSSARKF